VRIDATTWFFGQVGRKYRTTGSYARQLKEDHPALTLEDLGTLLDVTIELFRLEKPEQEPFVGEGTDRVFVRPVLLTVDREAPWIWAQWVANTCAESHATQYRFSVRLAPDGAEGALHAELPNYEEYVHAREEKNLDHLQILEGFKDKAPCYRFCSGKCEDVPRLVKAVTGALRAKPDLWIQVDIDPRCSAQYVIAALDALYGAGAKHVWWLGPDVPPKHVRQSRTLPDPDWDLSPSFDDR